MMPVKLEVDSLAINDGIPDLLIEQLQHELDETSDLIKLLSFDDHLLRRFGQLELIRKDPGELQELSLRAVADEIWFLIGGKVRCICRDLRPGSPSEGQEVQLELSTPSRILVPFGVAFGWHATDESALMLRCSTHQDDDHPDDHVVPIGASG
jgi:dTDP-4-dehydrorhamnose 3,5-epimerase-like enzyme